jgi:hypothetical protein
MLLTLALLAALSAQPNPLAAANKALADQDWARIGQSLLAAGHAREALPAPWQRRAARAQGGSAVARV